MYVVNWGPIHANTQKYFLTKLSISHLNKIFNQIWMKDYALSVIPKISNLVLGCEMSNYFSEVKSCIKNNQILFRARFKNSHDSLVEVSIWEKKKHFDRFFINVKGAFVFSRLTKEGFKIELTKQYVDDNFIRALIKKLRDKPPSQGEIDFNNLAL